MSFSTSRLILVDPQCHLCECWKQQFLGLSHVEIVNGRFEDLEEFDCMVSAADSFGLMDGGVDLAITDYFGVELKYRVQEKIIRDYLGEQPVGTSFIVETGNPKHRFVAHTPTMRVPMRIATTDYVFAAMWAMLVAVHQHNR
jgi:O-acetyl-ADP-ribose deacetylase (regulator of RNase III)